MQDLIHYLEANFYQYKKKNIFCRSMKSVSLDMFSLLINNKMSMK